MALFRPEGSGRRAVLSVVRRYLPGLLQVDLRGRLLIITPRGVRSRRLPRLSNRKAQPFGWAFLLLGCGRPPETGAFFVMGGGMQTAGLLEVGRYVSTRTWPVRPRSSMMRRISAWVAGAAVASRRQERSTWMLRSWPERSLGISLEPKRFQDSGGTLQEMVRVTEVGAAGCGGVVMAGWGEGVVGC